MAFDLNKNDGSNQDSSNKTSTKFDLSKNEAAEGIVAAPSSKSKIWITGLVGVLIIGGGLWYYSSPAKTEIVSDQATTAIALRDSTVKTPSDGQVAAVTPAAKEVTVAAESTTEPVAAESTAAATAARSTAAVEPVAARSTTAVEPVAARSITAVEPTAARNNRETAVNLNHKIPATFAQGSSTLIKLDQSLIRRIASYLAKNPDASIQVNGYASSDGSLEINQVISQARADAFKKYLVSKNIIENRVVALGKGIENPIASNDTDAGRKKNRRVEITLP